ncbi:serine/threonine-protein kinase [Nonomuraea sp. NPDC047529]|uniref:serine/threonine-protein kinase n=1 Tax=Nonomuraea sp. NPDC047529 TaxID=3155623 RepID=UPI0033F93AA6
MATKFPPLSPDDPASVAGYPLRARLGEGGMGKVYLSVSPGGRLLALKIVKSEYAADPEFRRRFRQEVQAAQRVQGAFTAPVVDADPDAAVPWLATAYICGPSLHQAVAEHGPLPLPTVWRLIAGVAEALAGIHAAGLVHRDLKPSNVLLAEDRPKVIDFGIARAVDATCLTHTGMRVGTPAFMTPEQVRGRPVTSATDVFALGQLAVFAATGRPAFGEGPADVLFYRITNEDPDLGGCPPALHGPLARCLSRDPADRPAPAEIAALAGARGGGAAGPWLPPAVASTLHAYAPPPGPVAPVRVSPTRPVRARRTRAALALWTGAAAVAVTTSALVLSRLAGPVPTPVTTTPPPPAVTVTIPATAPVRTAAPVPSPTLPEYEKEYENVRFTLPGGPPCTEGSHFQDGIDLTPTGPEVGVDSNGDLVYDCYTDEVPKLTVWDVTGQEALFDGTPDPAACVDAVNLNPLGSSLTFAHMRVGMGLCVVTDDHQVVHLKLLRKSAATHALTWSATAWARG